MVFFSQDCDLILIIRCLSNKDTKILNFFETSTGLKGKKVSKLSNMAVSEGNFELIFAFEDFYD